MSAAKGQPAPEPAVDPLLLAAADLRNTTAELREELAAVRLERAAHAELVTERDRLIQENHEHQKAVLLLLDAAFQSIAPRHEPAATNGSTDA